jgi:hypothetical protein
MVGGQITPIRPVIHLIGLPVTPFAQSTSASWTMSGRVIGLCSELASAADDGMGEIVPVWCGRCRRSSRRVTESSGPREPAGARALEELV